MIIDYNQGGPYPFAGNSIVGFPQAFSWFGLTGVDITNYLARIRSAVTAPQLAVGLTAPRIASSVEAVPGGATIEP